MISPGFRKVTKQMRAKYKLNLSITPNVLLPQLRLREIRNQICIKVTLWLGVGTLIYFCHIFFFRTQLSLRYHLFCALFTLHNHDFYRTHMNQNLAIQMNNKTERAFNFIGCAINYIGFLKNNKVHVLPFLLPCSAQ